MSSFINFNNKEVATETSYTAEAVKLALLKSETKSPIKAEALTKNIKEPLSLNEALVFFTDKLSAMKSLSLANAEINEGKIKQFEMDYKDMETSIKRGIGWIDPEYVEETWENSSDSIDFELVKTELYKRLIAAGLLAFSNPEDGETKGVPVRSLKDLNIKESLEADKVNETLFYAFFNNKKIEIEGKDLWDAKQKAITQLKVPKSKIGYLAVVSAESQKNQDFKFESFVNESEVETIELDMAWDSSSTEDDKAAKAAFKKYKIKVKGANGQPGTYEVTGKKKDILAYLKSDFYEMDQETIEEYYPELLEAYGKPAGLTKEETMEVAQKFADAMSKVDKVKVTVNKRTLEEDSFDLDVDGGEFDGGSYNIYQNGNVMNMALPSNPIYGKKNDSVDTIAKNMKTFSTNESKVNEGAMSDIDIMAQEAKDFKSFVKEFKKEHHDLSKSGEPGQFEAWLQTIYDTAKENMDESLVTEGQFSWMTQDTGNQIGSEKQNTITVTMFDDKGNKWEEKKYDGYGEFGGKDYYELLAQMNGIENPTRQDGIDIAFDKKKVKGKVLFPALVEDPKRFNFKKHDFTQEAEHDPNQSWYQEEEYDDDYEEYDESVVTEAIFGAKDFNKTLITYALDPKADEIYIIKVDTVIKSGFPDPTKVPDKRFHGMFGMMLDENWMKQYDKLPEVGDILPAPKKDKAFESKINEAARVPSNVLDFAKRKGSYATSLVKKAATWAEKAGKYISGGTAIGKNYDTIILDMKHQGSEIYINLNDETIELFGEEVTDAKSFQKVLDANMSESVVNEGRSINKIQKEWSETTTKMQQKAGEWKVAEGDRKAELLDEMKALTAKKRALEAELDAAVAGKDKDLELAVSEGKSNKEQDILAEIEKLRVASDTGKITGEQFLDKFWPLWSQLKDLRESVVLEGNAFGAARAKAIADGAKEFEFEGETYKVEDVGPDDKENAEEFVEESKLTLDALVEMFEVKVNEDIRSDVKKFIKDNANELNALADKDEWDLMYAKLYNEFNVEPDSTKGKDLLKTFQFVF